MAELFIYSVCKMKGAHWLPSRAISSPYTPAKCLCRFQKKTNKMRATWLNTFNDKFKQKNLMNNPLKIPHGNPFQHRPKKRD